MGSDSASLEQGPRAGLVTMSQRIDLEQMHVGRPRGGLAALVMQWYIHSGKHTKSHGRSPSLIGKSTTKWAIFNSYVAVYQRVVTIQLSWEATPSKYRRQWNSL